ncbi:hypothetical protein DAEQUDRAFT_591462 [Daedalea quercina L-15889]|uniref:Uncharacterized protein n=1 Tax=Daedalea quercina L-15889 TaxID=1314783 RepID=A0A165SWB6_9APHY|nr:hypothetical protein DAEQUDRAFT_591462 [Daedalea quercina L-15889]
MARFLLTACPQSISALFYHFDAFIDIHPNGPANCLSFGFWIYGHALYILALFYVY